MGNNPIAIFENDELRLNGRGDQTNDPVWLTQEETIQFLASTVKSLPSIFRTFLGKKT